MADDGTLDGLAGLSLADALGRILAAIDAETGTVHRLGPDGLLHLAEHAGGILGPMLPVIQRIPMGKGMAGLAALRDEPVQICNLQTDASGDARPGARATGMRGSICVPMKDRGKLVGVLGLAVTRERDFSEAEVRWLTAAGAALAAAINKT